MKTSGIGRVGVLRIFLVALILVFSLTAFAACNTEGTVEGVAIVEDSVVGYYKLGEFDISTVRLQITYEDGSSNEITARTSMLTAEDRNELSTAGEKHLTLYYKGKTAVLDIFLVEEGTDVVCVTFVDLAGNTLGKKYTVVGGSVEQVAAPEVTGQRFNGWVDADGKEASLTGLQQSVTLTATYLTVTNSYAVKFVDYKGDVLKQSTKNAGDTIQETDAPDVTKNLGSQYPELSGYSWGVTFPYLVTSDVTIQMSPIYKQASVLFAYALESNVSNKIYVEEYTASVQYGESVANNVENMEEYLTKQSFEIVTRPTASTEIKPTKDRETVTFLYVVRDASVTVKLYADSAKSTLANVKSPLRIGESLTLDPRTAVSVTGSELDGWTIYGKDASGKQATLFIDADDPTWTVTKDLGLSVEIVPVYKDITVPVNIRFVFEDDPLVSDDSTSYELTLVVNDRFSIGDVVSYAYFENLLASIQKNAEDYVKLLGGLSVPSSSDIIRTTTDNSSADRTSAFDHIAAYQIEKVTIGEEPVGPGESKVVVNQTTDCVVIISGETKGLRYETIPGEEAGSVKGYRVTGFTAEYVEGSNVFIPATHEDKPVLEIAAGALIGKIVTSLPAGLVSIGDDAFRNATVNGNLILNDLKTLGENAFFGARLTGTEQEGEEGFAEIRLESVTAVPDYAFAGLRSPALSVYLGPKATSVGASAFAGAQNLYAVTFPVGLTEIGENAFFGTKLAEYATYAVKKERPEGSEQEVETRETSASGVESIGNGAFRGTLLTEVSFPALKTLGEVAFMDMPELVSLSLGTEATSGNLVFRMNAVHGSTKVVSVAFGKNLTDIVLDDYVLQKEDGALAALTDEQIASYYYEGEDQTELAQRNILREQYEIFSSMAILASLKDLQHFVVAAENENYYTYEDVLYEINGNVYAVVYYPNDKTGSYQAILPEGKTLAVFPEAFANASVAVLDLSAVTVTAVDTANPVDTVFAVVIAEDRIADARTAFDGATVAKTTAEAAFYYENGLVYKLVTTGEAQNAVTTATVVAGYRRATEIVVPETLGGKTVTEIAPGAFRGYTSLTSLTVNATIKDWEESILFGDDALASFTVRAFIARNGEAYTPGMAAFQGNGWYDRHNVIYVGGRLVGYNNDARVNGSPLTTVTAEEAGAYFGETIPARFFENTNLTKIDLPASVKAIYEYAFAGSDLTEFHAAGVTVLGKNAFMNCTKLEEIEIVFTGTATMAENVFERCTSLQSATLTGAVNENSVSGRKYYYLPAHTFLNCEKLETVTMTHVNAFGKKNDQSGAFQGCQALTEFDFTKLIQTEIPAATFASSGLDHVIFTGTTIEKIGVQAFNSLQLRYVQLTSAIKEIGTAAFASCENLVVEIPYSDGGVYASDAKIGDEAFHANAKFFIGEVVTERTPFFFYSAELPVNEEIASYYEETEDGFFQTDDDHVFDGKEYFYRRVIYSTKPTIDFKLTTNVAGLTGFSKNVMTSIFIRSAEDLVAPQYDGYTFAGWFRDEREGTVASFPLVLTEDTTLYAKYYKRTQGSVAATTDVKFVYYLGELPELSLDNGESVRWTYQINGTDQNAVLTMPAVIEASAGDEFTIVASVRNSLGEEIRKEYFKDIGTLGYAIVKYSGNNAERMSIPDTYDDKLGVESEGNGEADIIVVYAGAFRNCIPKDFTLPAHTKAILLGYGAKDTLFSEFEQEGTFGETLKNVTIPASVEYIADGVFTGENVEEIAFEEGSNLLYATQDAFLGSAWWTKQLQNAKNDENEGFIIAGRLAVKYVGTADVLLLNGTDKMYPVTASFGFSETKVSYPILITVYKKDGTSARMTATVPALANENVVNDVYDIQNIDASEVGLGRIRFVLNSDDMTTYEYKKGKNLFVFEGSVDLTGIVAMTVTTAADSKVTVPERVIKLGDEIFFRNTDLKTVVLNKGLTTVGDRAFARSGLEEVKYGNANNEQYVSSVRNVGADAFAETKWWTETTKVILGSIFLKYNPDGGTAVNVTESITKIADGAFRGAQIASVNLGSVVLAEVGAYAFKGSTIGSIVLPKSVTTIGRSAFENCLQLSGATLTATSITEVSEGTFKDAMSLSTLLLPNTVKSIGKDALTGCVALKNITADGIETLPVASEGGSSARYQCGLDDTLWYKAEDAAAAQDDTMLRMGNVLVRYIVGKKSVDARTEDPSTTLVVTLPAGITMIAYKAFSTADSAAVTEIVIPNTVTEIGPYAFSGCVNMTQVTIGAGVKIIGNHAFDGLTALKSAILPDGLTEIGAYAFARTALVTEQLDEKGVRIGTDEGYTIPDSVKKIGEGAFYGVKTLTVVNLGSKIEELGGNAFNVRADGTTGSLYKINWDLDINKPAATLGEDEATLKAPIVKLAEYLTKTYPSEESANIFRTGVDYAIRFYADKSVVDYVKTGAFEGYNFWRKEGWDFYEVGVYPEVTFTTEGYTMPSFNSEYIVEGDPHVAEPPHHTESSGKTYTFMDWVVTVKNGKTVSPAEPFTYPYIVTGNMKLQARFYTNEYTTTGSVVEDDNNVKFTFTEGTKGVTITGIEPKIEGDTIEVLYIPNKINGKPVLDVDVVNDTVKKLILTAGANFNGMTSNEFSGFTALESIVVKTVGNATLDYKVEPVELTAVYNDKTYTHTFYAVYSNDTGVNANYGSKLIAVVGNVDAASEEARNDYREEHVGAAEETIRSIMLGYVFTVPDGVVEIYSDAFTNSMFETIALSDKVSVIGDNAFGKELKVLRVSRGIAISDVTYAAIPEDAPIMKANAGNQQISGTYIEINGLAYANGNYGTFYAIGNALVAYKTDIFEYNAGLVLPNTINGIDITVIASNININGTTEDKAIKATSITLPTNVQKINTEAFTGGTIDFNDVVNADNYARLREIANNVFNHTNFYSSNTSDSGVYVGKILIRFNGFDDEDQIRSDTIAIASSAFKGEANMTRITIPDSVRTIGSNAFFGCSNLTEVTIPNSVTTIGESAFAACKRLKVINIDAINSTLESIDNSAFANDVSLTTVRLPYGLKELGESAFSGCTALSEITFDGYDSINKRVDESKPSTMTILGKQAFLNCESLTAITIPEGVTAIRESTFKGCVSLVNVTFPRSSKLTEIQSYAFQDCSKLGSVMDGQDPNLLTVKLPKKLVRIGQGAFQNCSGLWGVSFQYNINEIGAYAFADCENLVKMAFYRDTAPEIANTVFGNDPTRPTAKYRLRIYVQKDPNQDVWKAYEKKWRDAGWENCGKYLYEDGTTPVVKYTYKDSSGVTQTGTEEGDVLPDLNVSGYTNFEYVSFMQDGKAVTEATNVQGRTSKEIKQYNASHVVVTQDGKEHVFLIVDYDEIEINAIANSN